MNCENTNKQQEDIDFEYEEIMDLARNHDVDSNAFNSSDDENVKLVKGHAFSSSLCFTQMRSLRKFCTCCQEVFQMYFVSKLHHFSIDVFSSS